MNLWQKAMICLATHPKIKQAVENKSLVRELGQRYIGGKDESDLIGKSLDLKSSGMGTSFFCLGEYIRDARVIDQTITSLKTTILLARRVGLDLHTSIDPTQAGLMISKRCCQNNLEDLAYWIKQGARAGSRDLLMMDMEDAAVTRDTLNIFHNLRSQGLPVGITLQACLIRTPGDLGPVMEKSTAVRLVKGAFAEKPKIALQPGNAVDRAYLSLADRLLDPQAIEKGVFPVFATHDPILIKKNHRQGPGAKNFC